MDNVLLRHSNENAMQSLADFRKLYPQSDSGDIQTFILGYNASDNRHSETKELLVEALNHLRYLQSEKFNGSTPLLITVIESHLYPHP